ncbi:OmpA family protein [Flavobacterium ardleyense]|uniref:OmpA family protein n=1 Tax=Flavobacterium ardleyense TaxID=2038737 RepID=A0ABW5ZAN0_9FLAO
MKKSVVLFLLINLSVFGQTKFTVYFDTASYQLDKIESNRLEEFLNNEELKITQIVGFCDFRASNAYNYNLSKNRALFVRNFIGENTNQTSIEIIAKGEDFQQDTNLALNRKVEIHYDEYSVKKDSGVLEDHFGQETDLERQVSLAKVGDKLILKNLYFYNRSGIVVRESKPILVELATILDQNPNLKIEIQGHICCQKGKDVEDTAKVRALAVYNYLVYKGIAKNRLSFKSFGSSKPIHKIPERNEDERNENRRVEIQIIEN